jgi:hypothetical protein
MVYAIILLALVLGGCGGHMHFNKPGATQADFDRDRTECQNPPGLRLSNPIVKREEWVACLQAKGWTLESVQGVPGMKDRSAPTEPKTSTL